LNEAKAVEDFLLAAIRRLWHHPEQQEQVRRELEICGAFEFLERNVDTGLEVERARDRLIELELIISQLYSVNTLEGTERDGAFEKLRETLRNSRYEIDVLSSNETKPQQRAFSPPPPPPPAIVKVKHESGGGVIILESELGKDRDKSDARSVASSLWSVEIATASVASYGGTASETDFDDEEEEEEEDGVDIVLAADIPSETTQVLTRGHSARVFAETWLEPTKADPKGDLDTSVVVVVNEAIQEEEILKTIQEEDDEEDDDFDENELNELIAAGGTVSTDDEVLLDEEEVVVSKPKVYSSPLSIRLRQAVQDAMRVDEEEGESG
jgi:hypothetical protein